MNNGLNMMYWFILQQFQQEFHLIFQIILIVFFFIVVIIHVIFYKQCKWHIELEIQLMKLFILHMINNQFNKTKLISIINSFFKIFYNCKCIVVKIN